MSHTSKTVHFVKTVISGPLCGKTLILYTSLNWRDVTCKRCLRVVEHKTRMQSKAAKEKV